jgi:hypothetical protein
MSKFTLGPWEVFRGLNFIHIWQSSKPPKLAPYLDRESGAVAEIKLNYPGLTEDETALADARLIAAAPELYAACKEFIRKCECGEARSKRSYAQMKAAITKVEEGS